MEQLKITYYKTPIGTAKIEGNNDGITSITVLNEEIPTSKTNPACLQDCVLQLNEYFTGNRKTFNLKLNPQGTKFQKKFGKPYKMFPMEKP